MKLRCYGIVVILKRDVQLAHEKKIRYCYSSRPISYINSLRLSVTELGIKVNRVRSGTPGLADFDRSGPAWHGIVTEFEVQLDLQISGSISDS